jgi:serine O-acetyltransferase
MGLFADAKSIAKRDPAAKNVWTVILLYPGFHILIYHRLAHWCYRHHLFFLARLISQMGRLFTGIEIHPGARIGQGLFIDHGMGVVIGETAEIGDFCTIFHGVTLGGTGKDKGKRHPTLGNHVLVGAGAKLLGPFEIGDHAMIGSNAVVLHGVPEQGTVVGVPGKLVRHMGKSVDHGMLLDHDRTPDPIEQEICQLLHRVSSLEKMISQTTGIPIVSPYSEHLANLCCPSPSVQEKGISECPVDDTMDRVDDEGSSG